MNIREIALQPVQEVFQILQTNKEGLTSQEVAQRKARYGLNEVPQDRYYALKLLVRQMKTPFMYLIIFAMIIALMLGDYVQMIILLLFASINIALGWFQEWKAHQAVHLLRSYMTMHVRVLRDGKYIAINHKELVPGDTIIVQAGDGIPADVRFVEEQDLMVDESTMTGETGPVKKVVNPDPELSDDATIGYMGTSVVQGTATAVVVAIGLQSVGGAILQRVQALKTESTVMQQMKAVSRWILFFVIGGIVAVMMLHVLVHGWHIDWMQLLLFALALAITMTPESLPVIVTFCLSRGTFVLARRKVIVKRLSSVQDLGNVTLLCCDKTGTLTENALAVESTIGDAAHLLVYGALASMRDPDGNHNGINPLDQAFLCALSEQEQAIVSTYKMIYQVPFDSFRLRNTVVVRNEQYLVVTRGAMEAVLSCLSGQQKSTVTPVWQQWAQEQERTGKRVIALAAKQITEHASMEQEAHKEYDLHAVGLVALVDPIKPDVGKALKKAQRLGIAIKILTGDSATVAAAVGHQIGLSLSDDAIITGAEFAKKSEAEQEAIVERCVIFARVNPLDKYVIVRLLQKKYSVAYLGEGINDAPALNAADVGLVVQGAVYIAQEAADIILLKKSLQVIIEGIYQGRAVFANTIKYIKIMLIGSCGNFYSVAVASLFIHFLPMSPVQIVTVNVLSNIPLLSLATDTVAFADVKTPQQYNLWNLSGFIIALALTSSFFDALLFLRYYQNSEYLQTAWFLESSLTELVLIFSLRTMQPFFKAAIPSLSLIFLSILVAILTVMLPFIHIGQAYIHLVQPDRYMLIFVASLVGSYFVATEVVKLLYVRYIVRRV